jgi:hypothetical protein
MLCLLVNRYLRLGGDYDSIYKAIHPVEFFKVQSPEDCIANLTFCWPCIIMYHNNVTKLIHFHFHNHFVVSLILDMFRASSVHLQEALH